MILLTILKVIGGKVFVHKPKCSKFKSKVLDYFCANSNFNRLNGSKEVSVINALRAKIVARMFAVIKRNEFYTPIYS